MNCFKSDLNKFSFDMNRFKSNRNTFTFELNLLRSDMNWINSDLKRFKSELIRFDARLNSLKSKMNTFKSTMNGLRPAGRRFPFGPASPRFERAALLKPVRALRSNRGGALLIQDTAFLSQRHYPCRRDCLLPELLQ